MSLCPKWLLATLACAIFFLAGCSQVVDKSGQPLEAQLGATEPPYFPQCVAREDGTFHQRGLDRTNSFRIDTGKSPVIDDSCAETEP